MYNKIKFFTFLLSLIILFFCINANTNENENEKSFHAESAWMELISRLKSDYAYMDRVEDEFKKIEPLFKHKSLAAKSKQEFIDIAQSFLRNFCDPHLNLGPYNEQDFSVYPTGSDIYAKQQGKNAIVIDIKFDSAAHQQGIKVGMLIKNIDGLSIDSAIELVTGLNAGSLTQQQRDFAINIALGGKRYQTRTLDVIDHQQVISFSLMATYDKINQLKEGQAISYKQIDNLGYIRFNNALGNVKTVTEFKEAVSKLGQTKGLIIDLRNTPSGGNTGVAEPIMGHFVNKETTYQRYRIQQSGVTYQEAELQSATVSPRQPTINQPYVVLAGRWTGSMGEGMTIGFDAIGAKAVIGAPMADLLGGIKQLDLVESDSRLEIAFERLYHTNGSFREDFEPTILVESADIDKNGQDQTLKIAIEFLKNI